MTAVMSGSGTSETKEASSARMAVFLSGSAQEVFQPVVYHPQIWTADPFDVETIYGVAREMCGRLLRRAASTPPPTSGRVLLLHGEAGSGKTHLLRAFRRSTHEDAAGYFGYLQMTVGSGNYGKYLLGNLISSLDQPYFPPKVQNSGLMRLSEGLFEAIPNMTSPKQEQLKNCALSDVPALVHEYADHALTSRALEECDVDLIRALLYLQRDDARLKAKVVKWLRCEDLSSFDRDALGGLVPRTDEEHPIAMVSQLGRLMYAVHGAAMVVCVDQLEDVFSQEMPKERFRKVIDTLVALVDAVPTAVVVIACLEDHYKVFRENLTRSKLDRLESDPAPIRLTSQRTLEEIEAMVACRLNYLYEEAGLASSDPPSVYPFALKHFEKLKNLSPRKVLDYCQTHRERCVAAGEWMEPDTGDFVEPPAKSQPPTLHMAQAWNEHQTKFVPVIPDGEAALAGLLAWGIDRCNAEAGAGYRFIATTEGRMLPIEIQVDGGAAISFLAAVCEKPIHGKALAGQVAEVEKRSNGQPVVLIRSTAFPRTAKADVSKQIGKLLGIAGRKVVVENSDWRTLLAFKAFHHEHGDKGEFSVWQRESRPLSQLAAMRGILALDKLPSRAPPAKPTEIEPPQPIAPAPVIAAIAKTQEPRPTAKKPDVPAGSAGITLGVSKGLMPLPIEITPEELKQHMAFLGGSGSGKTTAAMLLIEKLLLRGVPAILVDRKGDLSRYKDPQAWRATADPQRAAELRLLEDRIDVQLFTPGASAGRPLAIPVVPEGIHQMMPAERGEMAQFSASALGGMMGQKGNRADQIEQVILAKAIEVLAEVFDRPVTLQAISEIVEAQDPSLVNALGGGYEPKDFKRLLTDLSNLRNMHNNLLTDAAEPLDIDMLLGRGLTAIAGKTRLSIINTQSLRSEAATDFWVSQFLVALDRWRGKHPSDHLQAIVLLDEADKYLPAVRKPPTKAPLESLLRRARSAGIGFMLATQSPGDFDYRCKENIRAWLIGRVKEPVALSKLKPMLSEGRGDAAAKLAGQQTGEFYLVREKEVVSLKAHRSLIETRQLQELRILELARTGK